jgi:hypothetical protein
VLTISGGNTADLDGRYLESEVDGLTTNEVQTVDTFALVGNTLRLGLSITGQPYQTVDLSAYLDNTDAQTISTGTNQLTISGGNTVTVDSDPTNDLTTATDFDGDVDGIHSATVVEALQAIPVSTTDPVADQVLKFNGSAWAPGTDDNTGGEPPINIPFADSTVSGMADDPTDLTWTKIHHQRKFELIDENFIHYQSRYESNEITDYAVVTGTTPTAENGKLKITGTSFLKTRTGPHTPWFTVEADILSIGESGARSEIGPALIFDISNYIACVYDAVGDSAKVIVNGTAILKKYVVLTATVPMKLYMVNAGDQISFWIKQSGRSYFVGVITSTEDLRTDGALDGWKYGIMSYTNSGTPTKYVSSLRGGVSGGTGLLNFKLATNEDGSPYTYAGKVLCTADWANLGTLGYNNFTIGQGAVFLMDQETFQMESVGRIFIRRTDINDPGVTRITGATDLKLTWYESEKKWLMVHAYADWDSVQAQTDSYSWLDYEAPFGETIIEESQLDSFGIDHGANPYLVFDTRVVKINNTWYMFGIEPDCSEGGTACVATRTWPIVYSGASLAALGSPVRYSNSPWESGTLAKIGGDWYVIFYGTGETLGRVFTFPGMSVVGDLDLPYAADSEFPGYEWLVRQKNEKSEYLLVGFDTEPLTLTDVVGGSASYPWSRGNTVAWLANETATGYEFPLKIATQRGFPMPQRQAAIPEPPSAATAPGGSTTQVQYNNAGAFGGDAALTIVPATGLLTLAKAQSAATTFSLENSSTNAAAESKLILRNNTINLGIVGTTNSNFVGSGVLLANTPYFYGDASTGIALVANQASGAIHFAAGGLTERMRISSTGQIRLNAYGVNAFTGTAAKTLAVEADGDIIEISAPTGSGTTNNLAKWTSASALGNSLLTDNGTTTVSLSGSTAAGMKITNTNTNTGNAATTSFDVTNDAGKIGNFGISSAAYNQLAMIGANSTFFYVDAPGGFGMVLNDASSTFRVSTGGVTEKLRIDATGALSIGSAANANTSAIIDATSTTKGILFPRMTGTQRDAISSPANGLVIYNTSTDKLQVRAAGAWVDLH